MSLASSRTCPHTGCDRRIVVASGTELEAGEPLWRCSEGHHGPLVVGSVDPD